MNPRITSNDLLPDKMYEAQDRRRFLKVVKDGRCWYISGETGITIECKVWQFLEWVNK